MQRLSKFFLGGTEDNIAQSFLAPTNGYSVSTATRNGLENFYGPGTMFQGQLSLQLAKQIRPPCRLRVVFRCLHTINGAPLSAGTDIIERTSSSSENSRGLGQGHGHGNGVGLASASPHQHNIFEIEHVLVQDEAILIKRHTFMFNIKFPRVNFPPSMIDGERSIIYTLHSELSFETTPGDLATLSTLTTPSIQLKYLPLVPTCIPHYPVIELAQVTDPYTNKTLVKAAMDSPQRGVCPGEALPFTLTITNLSETDLQSIHLSLIRVISYPGAVTLQSSGSATGTTVHPAAPFSVEPTTATVHAVTVPVSNANNKGSTWMETLEFKVPANLGLVPTLNSIITPLIKVDYYLSVSIPIASRSTGLASWFTTSSKSPPPIDISLIRSAAGNSGSGTNTDKAEGPTVTSPSRQPQRTFSADKLSKLPNFHMDRVITVSSTLKWPTLVQLPPVPVVIGTVPFSISERQLRWPMPNYLNVMDRPRFIRDRFEEEMMQHLEQLETMVVEDEDEEDIETLVKAAVRKSTSSGESDDEELQHRTNARVPPRFRKGGATLRKGSLPTSGLGTPPPSPPSAASMMAMMDTVIMGGTGANPRTGPNSMPRAGRRSMSPKSMGLSRELLMEIHHSKAQQAVQSRDN
ncbi:hypothetical protein BGW38_008032 [Lunasporangiospora selenospora]|uniref:Arrestin C-terminal-like domain-containing protein n=1 Tax=Lunasporangiospora selenospora TaxID=979761 RepID=A0A9P6FYV3_9FUNG|nr:hypothetical protein BGW38_008032 [Lunasporangiospora selenospora]